MGHPLPSKAQTALLQEASILHLNHGFLDLVTNAKSLSVWAVVRRRSRLQEYARPLTGGRGRAKSKLVLFQELEEEH